jgi:hypothetical protein
MPEKLEAVAEGSEKAESVEPTIMARIMSNIG